MRARGLEPATSSARPRPLGPPRRCPRARGRGGGGAPRAGGRAGPAAEAVSGAAPFWRPRPRPPRTPRRQQRGCCARALAGAAAVAAAGPRTGPARAPAAGGGRAWGRRRWRVRRGQGGTGPVAGEEEQTLPREATMSLEEIFFREHSISNAWGETLRKKTQRWADAV
jgi:hypothetical protein